MSDFFLKIQKKIKKEVKLCVSDTSDIDIKKVFTNMLRDNNYVKHESGMFTDEILIYALEWYLTHYGINDDGSFDQNLDVILRKGWRYWDCWYPDAIFEIIIDRLGYVNNPDSSENRHSYDKKTNEINSDITYLTEEIMLVNTIQFLSKYKYMKDLNYIYNEYEMYLDGISHEGSSDSESDSSDSESDSDSDSDGKSDGDSDDESDDKTTESLTKSSLTSSLSTIEKSRIGAHINTTKGFNSSIKYANDIGCTAMQIFLKSPKGKYTFERTNLQLTTMAKDIIKYDIKLAVHASYTLNFCRDMDNPICQRALVSLRNDIRGADLIGVIGVVVHMGKAVGIKKDIAINNYVKGISRCLEETKDCNVKILLETGANVGTEVCSKIDSLGELFRMFSTNDKKRLGICIDTAHIWGSGYDISTKDGVKEFFKYFQHHIGWEHVDLIHLNDSKVECASKKDRHESIGQGRIGLSGLTEFVKSCVEMGRKLGKDIPIVLETPTTGSLMKEEIKLIKSMVK